MEWKPLQGSIHHPDDQELATIIVSDRQPYNVKIAQHIEQVIAASSP
jgi:hypothetical protein